MFLVNACHDRLGFPGSTVVRQLVPWLLWSPLWVREPACAACTGTGRCPRLDTVSCSLAVAGAELPGKQCAFWIAGRLRLACRAAGNVQLASQQHLNINFNPASLLSIGDALAFASLLAGRQQAPPQGGSEAGSVSELLAGPRPRTPPRCTSRWPARRASPAEVPQKYLIQNQSGLCTFYWGAEVGAPPRDGSVLCPDPALRAGPAGT